ncbi:MAG: hypothetical protein AAGA67_11795, partial [Cyanobacteria bacterium P01_F01_bin.153]
MSFSEICNKQHQQNQSGLYGILAFGFLGALGFHCAALAHGDFAFKQGRIEALPLELFVLGEEQEEQEEMKTLQEKMAKVSDRPNDSAIKDNTEEKPGDDTPSSSQLGWRKSKTEGAYIRAGDFRYRDSGSADISKTKDS